MSRLHWDNPIRESIRDKARKVYFIQCTVTDKHGNYIPCIAVEGEKGFYKTDWQWGKDYDLACECADDMNEKLGHSKREAMKIQLSTM